jgi:hypothetical protein
MSLSRCPPPTFFFGRGRIGSEPKKEKDERLNWVVPFASVVLFVELRPIGGGDRQMDRGARRVSHR